MGGSALRLRGAGTKIVGILVLVFSLIAQFLFILQLRATTRGLRSHPQSPFLPSPPPLREAYHALASCSATTLFGKGPTEYPPVPLIA